MLSCSDTLLMCASVTYYQRILGIAHELCKYFFLEVYSMVCTYMVKFKTIS